MSVNAASTGEFRLRLLGGATLEHPDGTPVSGSPAQRHRIALLALLALDRGAPMTRDRLASLLWPEADERQARRRLRESLYVLRKTLGRDAIVSAGEDVRLRGDALEVDVVAFERAIERGDLEAAVERYGGPFLEGFHLPDVEEFERWAEATRNRLERRAAEAIEALAHEAAREDRLRDSIAWWRRLVALKPYSSGPVLELMRSLVAAGERGEALRHARRHEETLRRDLDVEPEPEIARLVERLRETGPAGSRGGGSRTRDPAEPVPEPPEPDPLASAETGPGPPSGDRTDDRPSSRRVRRIAVLAASLGLVTVALTLRHGFSPAESEESAEIVAVLPFTVRGSARLDYLQDGVAELLGAALDGAGSFRSVDPRAVLGATRGNPPPVGPGDGLALARRFGARFYVIGSVVEAGDEWIRYQADLYDTGGERIASATTVATADDLLAAIDDLARQLVASRYGEAGERLHRLAATTTTSLPALKAYLDGEAAFRGGRFDEAYEAFREATRRDSTFALAWYRLAVAADWTLRPHRSIEATEKSVRFAARLPERDRLLIEAWRAQAYGRAGEAERLYHRVLETRPTDLEARTQLGEVLFHYGPRDGRPIGASRSAFEHVLEIAPEDEGALLHLARIAAREGRREDLERLVERLEAVNPAGELVPDGRALLAFDGNDAGERTRILARLQELDSDAIQAALWSASYAWSTDGVEAIAGLLTSPRHAADVRAVGHGIRATVAAGQGRWGAAGRELAAAERLDPDWTLDLRGFLRALPFAPRDPDTVAALRDRLRARLDAARAPTTAPVAASTFVTAHDGARPVIDTYLTAVLGDDDPAALREAAGALAEFDDHEDPAVGSLARDLARGLRARAFMAEGRSDPALAELENLEHGTSYERAAASPFFARSLERFLHARLLQEAGRYDEALRLYDSFTDYSLYDLAFRAEVDRARRLVAGMARADSRR